MSARVVAVLGPTNTGKTHLAMERLLAHDSGMIGFPLRLLARENYDKAVRARGAAQVALVTGEEKILPRGARYFICTVESMPVDRPVAFLAVDEIQLAADPDRGHIFTSRLLHARGHAETMFLGAETIRPLLRRLIPGIEILTRPRLSSLTWAGPRKLTRLPPRSAVVAFSVDDVYRLAEVVRRQRGGAAVVMGALSPRARNAQVDLYQGGDVDYLIATDAIGMGLNMDVDHVAFAELAKFDGRRMRRLAIPEIAQIAGRAGRARNDGTFGTTDDQPTLEPEWVERIEDHRFDTLKALCWRNEDLDWSGPRALLRSLDAPPPAPGLVRGRDAGDRLVLEVLLADPEIEALAASRQGLALLWEVCQVPDFRKTLHDGHARLLTRIYHHLLAPAGRLPTDWVADQIGRLDRTDGDIDTLTDRIAHIRTWTYIAHRGDWLADPADWQGRTRAIEDRLSDALHQRLTQRFVDRRTSMLVRRMRETPDLFGAVAMDGSVLVEGEHVGRLDGFRFDPDLPDLPAGEGEGDRRALLAAARRALGAAIRDRVARCLAADDAAFALDPDGLIRWEDAPVGRLAAGPAVLDPRVKVLESDLLSGDALDRVRQRLAAFVAAEIRRRLAPLFADLATLPAPVRGLAFQVVEHLGSVPRHQVADQVAALTPPQRKLLRRQVHLRLGAQSVYHPRLLKPAAVVLRGLLWAIHHRLRPIPPPLPAERVSVARDIALPEAFYEACGYRPVGDRAVRLDALERLADTVRDQGDGFVAAPQWATLIGAGVADLDPALRALGYRRRGEGAEARWVRHRGRPHRPDRRPRPPTPDSPFAELRKLKP